MGSRRFTKTLFNSIPAAGPAFGATCRDGHKTTRYPTHQAIPDSLFPSAPSFYRLRTLEVPQELGSHLSQAGGGDQGVVEARQIPLPFLVLGVSESCCLGLVGGQGQPGVNSLAAPRLRGCTEAQV